jgi:hypothetical protein
VDWELTDDPALRARLETEACIARLRRSAVELHHKALQSARLVNKTIAFLRSHPVPDPSQLAMLRSVDRRPHRRPERPAETAPPAENA